MKKKLQLTGEHDRKGRKKVVKGVDQGLDCWTAEYKKGADGDITATELFICIKVSYK